MNGSCVTRMDYGVAFFRIRRNGRKRVEQRTPETERETQVCRATRTKYTVHTAHALDAHMGSVRARFGLS